ncbi:MAG: hypothetical protein PHE55_08875 [Methylococcaceae bacterium]|nr:hypothetical protein [Methylococcaceae bacterium]
MSQKDAERESIKDAEGVEHSFAMFMLPPMKSHDLLMDVARMVGPSLGPVLDAMFSKQEGGDTLDRVLPTDFFTRATVLLFSGLDKVVLREVMGEFRKVTLVDNKPLDGIFDSVFGGKLEFMYKWLGWGMKVQWGKSFSALGELANAQGAEIKSRFPFLNTLPADGSK